MNPRGKTHPQMIRSKVNAATVSDPKKLKLTAEEIAALKAVLDRSWEEGTRASAEFVNRQQAGQAAQRVLRKVAITLLDQWKESVDSAIAIAPLPEEKTSQKYWWVALAGNLLWASTVYMNPAFTLAKVSSFSGAVFGTGLVVPKDEIYDGRNLVRQSIADLRGALEEDVEKWLFSWVQELFEFVPFYDAIPEVMIDKFVDVWVWDHLFDVPYDVHRFKRIGDIAFENIKAALKAYNDNFSAWRDLIPKRTPFSWKYGVDDAMGVLPFDPGIDKALGRPGLRIAPPKKR